MISNYDVVKQFVDGGKDCRSKSVIAEGDTLYSYGHPFPLAVKRNGQDNIGQPGRAWVLLNGDKRSVTTSKHQTMTFSVFQDEPRISFSALLAADLDYRKVKLVSFTGDEYKTVNYDDPLFSHFRPPNGATVGVIKNKVGDVTQKWYHKIGAVVLRDKGKDYLCGMDERQYSISQLPVRVSTVESAYEALKPQAVRWAELDGRLTFRQGDWFFVERGKFPRWDFRKAQMSIPFDLPVRRDGGNTHRADQGIICGGYFVMGRVRHGVDMRKEGEGRFHTITTFDGKEKRVEAWSRSGEHKTLVLPRRIVFEAIPSMAIRSWGAGGRVD